MATREQLIEDFADHKYATGEKFARLINSMKLVQEPVESPAESGTSNSFIDSISQGADGKITATKKSVVLNYVQIQDKPTINGVTLMGDQTAAQLGLATANQVEVVSNKVDKLPSGYYYGKFNSVEDLPEATEKGYAYVASSDPTVFYTYLVSGAGAEWVDSGNKMVNTIDITTPKTAETELSKEEKYYASANVSDRPADVVIETGVVRSLGYRVLSPNLSFAEQVVADNTIYDIKDFVDLGGVWLEVKCSNKIYYGTTDGYFTTAVPVTVGEGQTLTIESYDLILIKEGTKYYLIQEGGSVETSGDYYIATYGKNTSLRYWIDDGEETTSTDVTVTVSINIECAFYTTNDTVTISNNEAIYVAGNVAIFNAAKTQILQRGGVYSTPGTYYLAKSIEDTGDNKTPYFKGPVVEFKQSSILKFNGGIIKNGFISPNNCSVETNGQYKCFDNVFVTVGSKSLFKNKVIKLSWFCNNGEDAADVLTSILNTTNAEVYVDLDKVYLTHPVYIFVSDKSIRGCSRISNSAYSSTAMRSSRIYRGTIWDSSGYLQNAMFHFNASTNGYFSNLELIGLPTDTPLDGNSSAADTNTHVKYLVDYGLYNGVLNIGEIKGCVFQKFAIAGIRIVSTELFTISSCRGVACGVFILALPYKISKHNILKFPDQSIEGINPLSLLRVDNSYTTFCNYGIVMYPGTDVHIEKNCLSHTSLYAIYSMGITSQLTVSKNYFEGIGSGRFWIDKNGLSGHIYNSYPNTLCDYLLNEHRGEYGSYVKGGWGVSIGSNAKSTSSDRRYRSALFFTNVAYSMPLTGFQLDNNFSSVAWLRSSRTTSGNSELKTDDTVIGIDAFVFVDNQPTLMLNNTIRPFNSKLPYYYVIQNANGNLLNGGFSLIVDRLYPLYQNTNWLLTSGNSFYGRQMVSLIEKDAKITKNPNYSNILDSARRCYDPNDWTKFLSTKYNINSIAPYEKEEDGIVYHVMPHTGTYLAIGYSIPASLLNDGPRFVELHLENKNQTTAFTFNVGLLCSRENEGSVIWRTFNDYVKSYYVGSITLPAGEKRTVYLFLSTDIIPSDALEIGINIGGGAGSLNDGDILVSAPYMKYIGYELNTNICNNNITNEGFYKKGNTANRPVLTNAFTSYLYYDTDLGKPIYWNGLSWIDFNGDFIFDNSGTLNNRKSLNPNRGQQFKLIGGDNDVYLIYGAYGWLNCTDGTPFYDDSGTLNAMYDKYNYTLLTEEPSDWPTKYNTYYKIVDGVYTKLTELETWATDTYYKLDVNAYKGIQVKLTDTDTELLNKVVKWNGTKYINIVDNVALKAGTPIVTFTTENNTTTAAITSTSSGKIYYTKNGDAPTSSSTEYSSAITLADGDQVKAICIRDHMDNSNIGFVPVATPVITFNDGILHIECDTPDAKIYYTTDGNRPSTSSTVYDSSASVTIATGITVKAFATLIGRVNSEVTTKKRS